MKICPSCKETFTSDSWHCPLCQYTPPMVNGFLAFAPDLAAASEGFEASFFEQLMAVESQHFWFEVRNRILIWALQHYFKDAVASGSFLEIGCGTGFVLSGIHKNFPPLTLSGSEIFVDGLDFAQRRSPDTTFFQMDARHIPYEKEFDVIGAFDVLEHINEDTLVLEQLYRATKPGGGILLTVPQHPFLWSVVDEYSHHCRRYTRSELVEKMQSVGFKIERVTSFVSLLLPLIILSRTIQNRSPENYDPMTEFKVSPLQNTLLSRILDLERIMIRGGISFPVGSSLFVVAKKVVEVMAKIA